MNRGALEADRANLPASLVPLAGEGAEGGRKLLVHSRHFRRAGAQVPRRPWMAVRGRHPWRSDEGGASEGDFAQPTTTLTRRAARAGLSRQRERRSRSMERRAI